MFQFKLVLSKQLMLPLGLVKPTWEGLDEELWNPAQDKMMMLARQRYWWPKQHRCNTCEHYASFKSPSSTVKAPLPNIMAGFLNEIVSIDLIGSLPIIKSGNYYVLVIVNLFTKKCEAIPIAEIDTLTIGHAILKDLVARWGASLQLLSNEVSNIENQVINALRNPLGIKNSRTTTNHPQGNKQVEHNNKTLKISLAHL